jgi:guanyl-specific ribonuclease Sa
MAISGYCGAASREHRLKSAPAADCRAGGVCADIASDVAMAMPAASNETVATIAAGGPIPRMGPLTVGWM